MTASIDQNPQDAQPHTAAPEHAKALEPGTAHVPVSESEPRPSMDQLRQRIDAVDAGLLELLRERQGWVLQIGRFKSERGDPIVQPARERQLYETRRAQGRQQGLEPDFVEAIWHLIHDESCRQQILQRAQLHAPQPPDESSPGESSPGESSPCEPSP